MGAAVLAAAATIAVLTNGTAQRPDPQRAPMMLDAAARVVASDPVPGPGEYLRVRTQAEYVGMDGSGNGYVSPELHETFLPAGSGRPVIKRITYFKPRVFFGPSGPALAASDWAALPPAGPPDRPKVHVERDTAPDPEPLPQDPRQLLDQLRTSDNPADLTADQFLFDQLADILQRDGVTADLQAAAYRALALIPGVSVAAGTAVEDGITGTAFALSDSGLDSTKQIVIDPGSGRYLGERLILNRADGAIPAGTLLESTAVSTGVVSTAPRPTTVAIPPVQLPHR